MPRTTRTVMALLAGVAFIGAAAHAEAASTTPLVLDNAALDTVTAGNYGVFVDVFGAAAGAGNPIGSAEVTYLLDAQGNGSGGAALGQVGALGFGIGEGAAADSFTESFADGDVDYARSFRKVFGAPGSGFALDFSYSIGWAGGLEEPQIPAAALAVLGFN